MPDLKTYDPEEELVITYADAGDLNWILDYAIRYSEWANTEESDQFIIRKLGEKICDWNPA